jgi:hypothetical protein
MATGQSATEADTAAGFESEVQALGHRLLAAAGKEPPRLYRGIGGWLVRGTMEDAALRTALFEFVDALPQLDGERDTAAHLAAYLSAVPTTGWRQFLIRLTARRAGSGAAPSPSRR